MNTLRKLYRGDQEFDFPKLWRPAIAISLIAVVVSVGSLAFRELNLGIEFEGGTSWEIVAEGTSVSDTRAALAGTDAEAGKIQTVGDNSIRVRSGSQDPAEVAKVTEVLAELADHGIEDVSVTTVGPSWGDQITGKARNALIWFFILIAAYIAIRLEWKMAVGALIAVIHDIILTVGFYSVFQFEVTPATVIAFLTIMGYSLYDTIVVYDKVHEISGRLAGTGRYTYAEMMNQALNRVLMRSINASLTSMIPVASMLVVGSFFLGALTLQEFAIALLVGLFVGAYSSIFIASASVTWMKSREESNVAVARKLEARGLDGDGTRSVAPEDLAVATAVNRPTADRPRPGNAPPRPRKKKKKR